MGYEAVRWRLEETWTPWHWVSTLSGKPICGDPSVEFWRRKQSSHRPDVVTCEKCKENKTYLQSVQDYESLLDEMRKRNFKAKDPAGLVEYSCLLAEKHNVTFDAVYGLAFLQHINVTI